MGDATLVLVRGSMPHRNPRAHALAEGGDVWSLGGAQLWWHFLDPRVEVDFPLANDVVGYGDEQRDPHYRREKNVVHVGVAASGV